jgi:hypothetical protein
MVHQTVLACLFTVDTPTSRNTVRRLRVDNAIGAPRGKCYFQASITYKADTPGLKAKIWKLTCNYINVRSTARVLGINKRTVSAELKKPLEMN